MTTETILTDAEIITIGHQARAIEFEGNGYILPVTFARAIEQAVLQSPKIQQALADTKHIDWLADAENTIGSVLLPTECVTANLGSLRAAIDAATRMAFEAELGRGTTYTERDFQRYLLRKQQENSPDCLKRPHKQ